MALYITLASSPEEIDATFKIRHQVFCEEEGKFLPREDGRLYDRFDTYPTTHSLIVKSDGQLVGSMRMTLDSAVGVPADEYYDFRTHLPAGSTVLGCGMYCVTQPYRSTRLAYSLVQMACYFAVAHQVSHIVAPINPAIAKLVQRLGFQALGGEIVEPHTGLSIVPVLLDMTQTNDFFLKFAHKNRLQNFLGAYDCMFFEPGEVIIHAGEHGDTAYVIIEGEAEVFPPHQDEPVDSLVEGEVFGELALLTDEIRSATVIAKTHLRAMTLSKQVFLDYLLAHPDKAMEYMRLIGTRMRGLLNKL